MIAQFVQYASKRLKPLGVRVSADVFGLAATRDLGIGQIPKRIGRYLDAIYPMVYPSHFGPGEYNLDDPNSNPGATVAYALRDFNSELAATKVRIIPWLQDFSWNRTYTLADVQAQIKSVAAQRDAYVKEQVKKQGLKGDQAFDDAVRRSIVQQAEKKGYKF